MDRRRQRRAAVHAEGRQVLAAAQHELLPVEAARHAGLVGERRARRLPDARARRDGARRVLQRRAHHEAGRGAALRLPPPASRRSTRSTRRRSSPRATSTPTSRSTEAAATGANTLNVHHANAINPYINYPFLRPAEMKAYIDEAHARGLKVKIYYTVRELSNRAPELFALRSLGDEILSQGPGGGFSWLQEHLGSRLHRGLVRPGTQGRRGHQHRRLALAQLLRRGARLAREERRDRRPLHRRRGVRPDDDEAGAEGARPEPPGRAHRPALGQPVQRPRTASPTARTSTSSTSRSSTASGSASTSTTTRRPTSGSSRSPASRSA